MKRILNENEQVCMTTLEISKLYDGLFVFATNVESTVDSGSTYCIPRIIYSTLQKISIEDTIQYKMNEKNMVFLDI